MSARLKGVAGPDRELEDVRKIDCDGRTALRHRTVDSLGKMLRAGTITAAMHDAARVFQTDFALAGLDPIRARPLVVPSGGGRAPELTERQLDARRRVHAAMEALGGISSPAGSAVWQILGCGCSVRQWALRRSWTGKPIRHELAMGILVAGMGVLAAQRGQRT